MDEVQFVNPPTLFNPLGWGFTQAVRAGNTVYVSGQVALDEKGNLVGRGDVRVQAEQVFRNLERALAACGARLTDVVKMTAFLTRREDVGPFREVRRRFFPAERPPASTLVVVSSLVDPEFLVEVEAVAVVPQGMGRRPGASS